MAAQETKLNTLHELLAQSMLDRLKLAGLPSADAVPLTAAEMTAMSKFLKDNGIQSDKEKDPKLGELSKHMGNVVKMPFAVSK